MGLFGEASQSVHISQESHSQSTMIQPINLSKKEEKEKPKKKRKNKKTKASQDSEEEYCTEIASSKPANAGNRYYCNFIFHYFSLFSSFDFQL